MSHEVLITRRQSILIFFANPGRGGPHKAGAGWSWLVLNAEARLCLDLQKNQKYFVFRLSGPHGTSNFDHQSLIHSDLNYTNWKALTNFKLWWDTNSFGVTLSGIWKNRSEIFHGTFCIQRRPRCTLQELGGHENSWFVSKFLLDSREKSKLPHIWNTYVFYKQDFFKKGCETRSKYVPLQCKFGLCCASRQEI